MSDLTPLMAQYKEIKSAYRDCILLFRVGDFYETFYEDAVEISSILNIALTTRDKQKAQPVPLAGVPFHAAENYITRLLSSGKKVAVCEQVEDAAVAKGLVRREVVEVLTPGTAMNAQLLNDSENNYCASVFTADGRVGVALMDVSTGDFWCGRCDVGDLQHLLQGKTVAELICPEDRGSGDLRRVAREFGDAYVTRLPPERFEAAVAAGELDAQFGTGWRQMLAGDGGPEEIAAGALVAHCRELRGGELPQVVEIRRLDGAVFLQLDEETIANLELFEPLRGGLPKATVIAIIDHAATPMGGRALRRWLSQPLCVVDEIDRRLDAVQELHTDSIRQERLVTALKGIADVQRLAARIASRKCIPREFHALRESLEQLPAVREALAESSAAALTDAVSALGDHAELCGVIADSIVDDPPGHLREGGVIKKGCDKRLDALIDESAEAKRWIAGLEQKERNRTGVGTLKVGFNKVFGYYIEVSKANEAAVPDDYIQKQTLVSAQRYYTETLKSKEQLILETEERRVELEQRIFDELCGKVASALDAIQMTSDALGTIDALQAFATAARIHGYRRPVVDDSLTMEIVSGRHPVLEQFTKEPFVPNDLALDPDRRQFGLITGPNMSGKSTYLRQCALIVIMAQMGCFVPAERARIGVVDQIFTRVGASDRLSRGESTFLVEMNETALILDRMTSRSFILLDEIGRGTSTFDGLSIAWAVLEYILQGVKARPRGLFATHFHELTQLRSAYPRLQNLKITIREWESGIIFLRKIVPGTSDKSFGIHAAKVAGLPPLVLKRAEEILRSLETRRDLLKRGIDPAAGDSQISLFTPAAAPLDPEPPGPARSVTADPSDPVRDALRDFDVDHSTPMDALRLIERLRGMDEEPPPDAS